MNWLVAQLQPNCEGIASRDLARQGCESVAPKYLDHQRRTVSLFPGYLFVLDAIETAAATLAPRSRGVVRVIGGLTHEQLEPWLCYREHDKFAPGNPVVLRRLGEIYGMCDGYDDADRVFVLFRMLGRTVRAKFERADLLLA